MPCYDGRENVAAVRLLEEGNELRRQISKLEALACMLLSSGVDLNRLDYASSGLSKAWVKKWWENHQKIDRKRRLK